MDIWKKKGAVSSITKETRRESHAKTDKQTLQSDVLKIIENHGEMTAREVAIALFAAGRVEYPARAVVQPRLTELVEAGWLAVCGKKYDETTERNVAVYKAVLHD